MRDLYKFETAVLPNGLSVFAAHQAGMPESVRILSHSGTFHDPADLKGLAHFHEHIATTGQEKSIDGRFKKYGGKADLGGTTGLQVQFGFYTQPTAVRVVEGLAVFAQLLLTKALPEDIETERNVVIAEYREEYPIKSKYQLALRERRALHHDDPWSQFVCPLGTPAAIRRITRADLRKHRQQHWVPANMSIVASGGIRPQNLIQLVADSPFGMRCAGTRAVLPKPRSTVTPPLETECVFPKSKYLIESSAGSDYRSVGRVPGKVRFEAFEIAERLLDQALFDRLRNQYGAHG